MPVRISSNIDVKNAADRYATHLGNLTKGGVHTKDSVAQMNNIPVERRVRMMLCVVADNGGGTPVLYWLNTPPNPTQAQLADNQYWQLVPLGVSIDGVLTLQGFQDAASLTIVDALGDTGDTYIVEAGGAVNDPAIFGGQAVNLVVGDYLVYEGGQWNVVPTGAQSVTWSTLTGKPSLFPPESHTHTISDITDFPDLSGYVLTSDVVSSILQATPGTKLANVSAIKNYVTGQIDAIQGYTLYVEASLTDLNTNVPSPNENDYAYIQDEFALYKYSNGNWVFQYTTSLPATNEAEGTFKAVTQIAHGFVERDVIARDGADYVKSISDDLTPIGVVVDVIDVDNVLLWTGGFTTRLTGLTPDSTYYIDGNGQATTVITTREIFQAITSSSAFLTKVLLPTDIAKEGLSSGILFGMEVTINGGDPSTFDVAAGKGLIIDNTVDPPVVKIVDYPGSTANTVTNLATEANTDLAIDENNNIIQLGGAGFTNEQFRTLIPIGGLDHNNNTTISNTFNFGTLAYNVGNQLRDLAQALGDINLGGNFFGPNGANLNLNYTGGDIYAYSENRANSINNPSVVTEINQTALSFLKIYNDGVGGSTIDFVNTIDPNFYDDGSGTLAAMTQNDWQIQKLYIFPNSGTKIVQYGENVYNTKEEALDNISRETITVLEGFETAFLRGYLIVQEGATDLSDLDQAEFRSAGRFGDLQESSGSGSFINDTNFQVIKGTSTQALFAQTDEVFVRRGATGVYYGGDVTITGANSLTIAAGQGSITDRTIEATPTFQYINWTQKTGFSINLANPITFLYLDDNSDTIKTTTTFPTLTNRYNRIYLSAIASDGSQIIGAIPQRDWIGSDIQQLGAVLDFLGEGKIAGGVVGPNGANLSIDITDLTLFDPRAGDSNINPHSLTINYTNPVTVQHIDQDGDLIGAATTFLDVENYDNGGTLTAVPSNAWQVMQIWAFEDGQVAVLYGQATYNNKAAAENSIINFSPIIPDFLQGAIRLCYLIVKDGTVSLSNTANADFRQTNKFGEFGGGASGNTGALLANNNLSDLTNIDLAHLNLLEATTEGTSTHSVDGTLNISYDTIRKYVLTLDANITTLTFSNLPDSAEFVPVVLRIEQNATTGYSIDAITNLENPDGVFPDYSTVANENSVWHVYKTSTGVRVIGYGNVT